MADKGNAPKTLQELSKVTSKTSSQIIAAINSFDSGIDGSKLTDILKTLEKIVKKEADRLNYLKQIKDLAVSIAGEKSKVVKHLDKEITNLDKLVKSTRGWKQGLDQVDRVFGKIVKQNEEIFRLSHDIQLEANITWKEYSKLYTDTYEAARKVNKELGQSVFIAKDLIATQTKLIGTGWKDIDVATLTNVSSSVAMLQKTLGAMPAELSVAFQDSYRQFGTETNQFITHMGNRLNAFSRTFGVTVGMLTGVVSEMMASNSFMARNNMRAQITANESLIKAAALSGHIGLASTRFITDLSQTARFGTMEEMSPLFQAGALIQGFDTSAFQGDLISGDFEGAVGGLFSGIHSTLNNLSDHYLRAEYMKQIGGAFGLSRDDLLRIATHGDNLQEYSDELMEKMENLDTSMVDELRDLKVAWLDRIENSILNNKVLSESVGSILQEYGLYGLRAPLNTLVGLVGSIALKQYGGLGGMTAGLLSGKAGAIGTLGAAGGIGLLGAGANVLGRGIQLNTNLSDTTANVGGGLINILGGGPAGVGTGALLGAKVGAMGGPIGAAGGAAIGGLVGAGIGIANTLTAASERKSRIQDIEDEGRERARQAEVATKTGEPIVDAIYEMNANLTNVLNGLHQDTKRYQYILDMTKKTSTVGEL